MENETTVYEPICPKCSAPWDTRHKRCKECGVEVMAYGAQQEADAELAALRAENERLEAERTCDCGLCRAARAGLSSDDLYPPPY
jgi:uncharacterized small protein (DUF1192 family)